MFNENGLPIQKKCVVAFVDLLGVLQKMEKGSAWTLDYMWEYYKIILAGLSSHERLKFKVFSDNILVCEEIDESNPSLAVKEVLAVVDRIEMTLFNFGALFLRGAVVVDDLHFSEDFVCGMGLVKAYIMERDSAIYPRILIDSSVIELVGTDEKYIMQDTDGLYFYNFLQACIDKGDSRLQHKLGMLCGNILTNIKGHQSAASIINKMEWLINYFNEISAKNNLKRRITTEDLQRCGITIDIDIL